MAEDEEFGLFRVAGAPFEKRFILSAEDVADVLCKTGFLAPAAAEFKGDAGMQRREALLKEAVVECPAHELVAMVSGAQAVPMAKAELPSGDCHIVRLLQDGHAQFGKIAVCPDVVVPGEEVYLHSGIHQLQKGRKNAHVALWNHIFVLVPEIPDISKHIERFRLMLWYVLQELDESGLPRGGIRYVKAQVDVGDKVCVESWHRPMQG